MSQSGALIEAASIPDPGTAVVLRRGNLQAAGLIAWRFERKAGLTFSTGANVADWLSPQSRPHQERVDEIISSLKSDLKRNSAAIAATISGGTSVLAELAELREDLAQLANRLASDAILVANHPEIQVLDIAVQRVERIATRLRESDPTP